MWEVFFFFFFWEKEIQTNHRMYGFMSRLVDTREWNKMNSKKVAVIF